MAKNRNIEYEQNQVLTTLPLFIEQYNKSLPTSFPRASVKTLKKFQVLHPTLFRKNDEWSIDKHRKRLMDWLSSYDEDAEK